MDSVAVDPDPFLEKVGSQFARANGTRLPVGVRHGFHPADYVLFAGLLLSSLAVGIYYAVLGQKTTSEYLRANKSLPVVPISLSIMMSYLSAILVLGQSAEMYTWGAQNWLQAAGIGLGYIFVVFVFVPLFHPLNLTSAFEVQRTLIFSLSHINIQSNENFNLQSKNYCHGVKSQPSKRPKLEYQVPSVALLIIVTGVGSVR